MPPRFGYFEHPWVDGQCNLCLCGGQDDIEEVVCLLSDLLDQRAKVFSHLFRDSLMLLKIVGELVVWEGPATASSENDEDDCIT